MAVNFDKSNYDEDPPDYNDVVSDADGDFPTDAKSEPPSLGSKSDLSLHDDDEEEAEEVAALDPSSSRTKSLLIHARGHTWYMFPKGSKDLETHITHPDGSPAYISTRFERGSGSCTLSHAKRGELITTTYRFGMGRPPQLSYVDASSPAARAMPSSSSSAPAAAAASDPIVVHKKNKLTSRTATFTTPGGRELAWHYAKDKATKSKLLLLSEVGGTAHEGRAGVPPPPPLATLVRNETTVPAGSSVRTAGNGGTLVVSDGAAAVVDEELVLATCLVMLKKEVDRRKRAQIAAMSGAAGASG